MEGDNWHIRYKPHRRIPHFVTQSHAKKTSLSGDLVFKIKVESKTFNSSWGLNEIRTVVNISGEKK